MKTQYDRSKLERIAFRWGNAWMRRLTRANANSKMETSPMAKSAREMCARRGWEYEGSTLWEETTQIRGMFSA